MDNESEPFFQVTPDNHAGWVVITTVSFVVYAMLGVSAKLVYRLQLTAMKSYDWAVILAMLLALVQSILVVNACHHGLGQHQAALPESTFDIFSKELYAASLLSVLAHAAAKISVALFVLAINARRDLKLVCYALLGIIVAWAVSSVFVIAFRCSLPAPWRGGANSCMDSFMVYLGINIVNIATDLALIVVPTVMMWKVQTGLDVRVQIISLFASRILVPIMLIPQTVYWAKHTGSRDQTWTLVEPSIWGQIAMNLSILTACVPSLKGVIDMFWSGASMFTVPGQYNPSSLSSGPGGIRSLVPSRFRTFTTGSQNRANNSNLKSREQRSNEHLGSTACGQQPDTILERSESQTRLTDNNIVRTVEYQVSSEPIDRTLNPRAAGSDGVSQTSL